MKLNIKPIVIGVVVIIIGSVFYFANESAQKVPNVPIKVQPTTHEVFPSGDCKPTLQTFYHKDGTAYKALTTCKP